MCGIAGVVNFRSIKNFGGVEYILDEQTHRGPDHYGKWRSDDGLCALGFNRLSIIDLSPAGHQPMLDPVTGNMIIFNGEIYNFLSLRKRLLEEGEAFQSKTDTEVILKLYRKHGVECLKHLRGMFAFALWDAKDQCLFIARDRLGEKPICYSLIDGNLVFASEIGALTQHPLVERDINLQSLELFLDLQYIPAPWSIYKDVHKLLPGHWAIFDRNGFRQEVYWELDYTQKSAIHSEAEALNALDEKLRESIEMRLIADVPLGSTLSGGVDSSLVVAMMAQLSDRPVKTFNIAFKEEAFDESQYARQVAEKYSTDHYVYEVESDIEEMLPKLVQHYGEPYGDKGAVPAFYVSESARQQVTVAMNGDGGDELLGGYPRYSIPDWYAGLLSQWKRWGDVEKQLDFLSQFQTKNSLSGRISRRFWMRYIFPEAQSLGPLSTVYWGHGFRKELMGELGSNIVNQWILQKLGDAIRHADHPIDRMLWLDSNAYLRDDGLVKMDIASMHCSLEARTPLVDHELVEFAASLPAQIKLKGGMSKYLLKRLAERYLPKDLIYRKKQGFSIPVDEWLRGPLQPYVHDIVLDNDLMEPLDMQAIQRVYGEFQNGANHHEYRIWLLLIFGLWHQMDKQPARRL